MFKSINGGIIPQRATKFSAGFDVFSNEDVIIVAGETKLIGLGIAIDADNMKRYLQLGDQRITWFDINVKDWMKKHYFALHIRSSLRSKGLTSLGTGIIDMDFTHEIKMVIHYPIDYFSFVNDIPHEYEIKRGHKIGQLILCRHEGWLLPSEYTKDEERTGGFGSTGDSK